MGRVRRSGTRWFKQLDVLMRFAVMWGVCGKLGHGDVANLLVIIPRMPWFRNRQFHGFD